MVGTEGKGAAGLAVNAPTAEKLIHEALAALLGRAIPGWRPSPTPSDRSVPIRAEAADLAEVIADLYGAAIDQIEGMGIAVAGVEIDGLLRSDIGLIAWGRVTAAEGQPAPLRRLTIVAAAVSEGDDGGLRLDLRLLGGGTAA